MAHPLLVLPAALSFASQDVRQTTVDEGRLVIEWKQQTLYPKESKVVFSGDVLFQGSIGRTDLPGGSFTKIIDSLHGRVLALPDETVVFPGHGPATTVGEERATNPFLTRK